MQRHEHPHGPLRQLGGILFWVVTGVILGVGVIAILSIGILLLLGFGLIVFGALRIGARELWAAIVGFGAAPALILHYDVATAPPLCSSGVSHPGMVCGGPTDAYQMLALVFAAIAVVGILVGLGLALIQRWSQKPAAAT